MTLLPRRSRPVEGRPAGWTEAGRGFPLVLVHGAGGHADVWAPQVAALAARARVIAVDLPGHGPLGGAGCTRVADYAGWLVSLLDALGLDRAVIGGHSMGGAVAQALALGWPDRVAGLVLVATGARLRVLPRLIALLGEDPRAGCALIEELAWPLGVDRALVAAAEAGLRQTPAAVLRGDFLACDAFDVTAELGRIRAPTLVVVGTEDRLTPPRYARLLAETIPGARLVLVPGAGHFVQLEQPAAVTTAIDAFLEVRAAGPAAPAGPGPTG